MLLRPHLCITAVLCLLYHSVAGQFGPEGRPDPPGSPKRTKTKFSAVPEEARFLKCDVCKKSVREMFHAVAAKRQSQKRKLTEEAVLEVVEQTCKPYSEVGLWILHTDLVQPEEDQLLMVQRDFMSRCKTECETVTRACHDTLGDVDTDVAELMYQNTLSLAQLTNQVCYELTDACKRKRSLTKPHKDEKFAPMPQKEYDMFKMIEETNYGGGRGGLSLYSRDDIDESLAGGMSPPPPAESANAEFMDASSSHSRGAYSDEPLPPDDWLSWGVWNVQKATHWAKSFFISDAHDEL